MKSETTSEGEELLQQIWRSGQRQKPSMVKKSEMIQAMLQNALVECFSLAVHRIPTEIKGFELVVGKQGPKFKEAKATTSAFAGPCRAAERWGLWLAPPKALHSSGRFTSASSRIVTRGFVVGWKVSIQEQDWSNRQVRLRADEAGEDYEPSLRDLQGNLTLQEFWDMDALGPALKPVKVPSGECGDRPRIKAAPAN